MSTLSVPDSGRVSCGLGSVVTIYADGLDVATGSETIEGTIPKDVDVIGVECTWPEQVSNHAAPKFSPPLHMISVSNDILLLTNHLQLHF